MKQIVTYISLTTLVVFFAFLYARAYIVAPVHAAAGINRTINFQGKLTNTDGTNVTDGSYTVVFKIYEEGSAGTALWTETDTVTTTSGIFHVALGSTTAIPTTFNFNWDGLYLGMKVGSDAEMTPRIRMTAVPYAFNAEKVSGLSVTDENGNASTSGLLKVANGSTISFGASFTTTASNALTLTTTGTTNITLPTTGTLSTLAGTETFTNKKLTDNLNSFVANGDITKLLKFDVANVGTGTTLTLALPSFPGTSDTLCLQSRANCAVGGSGGGSNWTINNGAIRPNNNTLDLLLGGTSTSSAKFAFLNLDPNSNQDAVASFSGNLLLDDKPDTALASQVFTQISGTAGTIGGGATTAIASVSASIIYNGSLYVGTYKDSGGAEIYRYSGTSGNWTKVSNATAGTIMSGGTSGIASVSAMMVYDGFLFAGTSKVGGAEIYRYQGGTNWVKVSNPTAGTIRTGGTALIDGVSSMSVFQGKLYVGTREGAKAEVYRYDGGINWSVLNATAGTFVATNTINVNAITAMVVKGGNLYVGTQKTGDADVLRYIGGQTWLAMNAASATGSYTINGTAVTGYDEVSAMTVYNGNVIVGLRKLNGAEVLSMNDAPSGAGVNVFGRMNNAVGQMTNGGTQNIDAVTALTVYNGFLYVGTSETNAAEVYRYIGDDKKLLLVSSGTGQLSGSGTTSISAITSMTQLLDTMYVGTMNSSKAEVYSYTASLGRSYALQFHAAPAIAGGEQNNQPEVASIYFLASASANLGTNTGDNGAFILSHGIQTRAGSYDVAEDYPTRDDSLEPGDIVSIDTNERGFIKKSDSVFDRGVIGVYSESPALRLTQNDASINGGRAIPVALAGRVEVKVSTESGIIRPGDYLVASSLPGVGMKAVKAGEIFGKALSGYDGEGVGKVMVYVNMSYVDTATVLATMSFGDDIGMDVPSDGVSMWSTQDGLTMIKNSATPYDQMQDIRFDSIEEKLSSVSARLDALEKQTSASSSALAMTPTTAVLSASVSTLLDPYNLSDHSATISGDLLVSGRTVLGDLGVTGNISAGLLTIKGLNSEINSIAGPLKLQNGTLDGLEFVGGAVTIDTKGNIITKASISTTKLHIAADSEHPSIGKASVKKGETETIIETTAVTKNSTILVTPKVFSDQLVVTKQDDGKSFTVEMEHVSSKDIPFDWWVVN